MASKHNMIRQESMKIYNSIEANSDHFFDDSSAMHFFLVLFFVLGNVSPANDFLKIKFFNSKFILEFFAIFFIQQQLQQQQKNSVGFEKKNENEFLSEQMQMFLTP